MTESNAHPHFDTTDRVHVVVNGIVENYLALRVIDTQNLFAAQGVTAVVGLVAAAVPVAGLVWFAGWGGDELQSHPESGIPVYMSQQAQKAPEDGILVLRRR